MIKRGISKLKISPSELFSLRIMKRTTKAKLHCTYILLSTVVIGTGTSK